MQVLVRIRSMVSPGKMRTHILKYDVEYDQKLKVARWQLLPGQGQLVFAECAEPSASS